jgi:hypothetical protein
MEEKSPFACSSPHRCRQPHVQKTVAGAVKLNTQT